MFTNYKPNKQQQTMSTRGETKLEIKSCSLISHEPNSLSTFPWNVFLFLRQPPFDKVIFQLWEMKKRHRERAKERREEMNSVGDWKQFEMDNNVKEKNCRQIDFLPMIRRLAFSMAVMLKTQVSRSGLVLHFYSVHARLMNAIVIYLSAFPFRHFCKWN